MWKKSQLVVSGMSADGTEEENEETLEQNPKFCRVKGWGWVFLGIGKVVMKNLLPNPSRCSGRPKSNSKRISNSELKFNTMLIQWWFQIKLLHVIPKKCLGRNSKVLLQHILLEVVEMKSRTLGTGEKFCLLGSRWRWEERIYSNQTNYANLSLRYDV